MGTVPPDAGENGKGHWFKAGRFVDKTSSVKEPAARFILSPKGMHLMLRYELGGFL